jgi:hypothetical protein
LRVRAILITIALSAAGFAAVLPTTHAVLVARGPILIQSNADFTLANGVVGGAGTPTNPFVIANWEIVSSLGNAITIRSVSASFVVENNLLITTGPGSVAVALSDDSGASRVTGNEVHFNAVAVSVTRAATQVDHNLLLAKTSLAVGVQISAASPIVANNTIDAGATAIAFDSQAPTISGNLISASHVGVLATNSAYANVTSNDFERVGTTLVVGQGVIFYTRNFVRDGTTAVSATGTAGLHIVGNTFDGPGGDSVVADAATVDIRSNLVISSLGRGFVAADSSGTITGNTINDTAGGIALSGQSVVWIQNNTMTDNAYGVSIPYTSRASIPHLFNDIVNGQSIQNVYHWRQANLAFTGGVYDAGYGSQHYGGLTAEGYLVFYDVDQVLIKNVTMIHGPRGVTAFNSLNVQVRNSTLLDLGCAVFFNATTGSVKNTTIKVPTDPAGTCGIDLHAGFSLILNNTITFTGIGIRADYLATGAIRSNIITNAQIGVQLSGSFTQKSDALILANNTINTNIVGVDLITFRGTLINNTIAGNTEAGIRLESKTAVTLMRNKVMANAEGIVDVYACTPFFITSCSSAVAVGNFIANNTGVGMRINGSATLVSNVFVNNVDGADLQGGVTARNNLVLNNSANGFVIFTTATVQGGLFVGNANAGILFEGTVLQVTNANVSANSIGIELVASAAANATLSIPVPGVPTVTVPSIPAPTAPGVPRLPGFLGNIRTGDPLYVHKTIFEHNKQYAIKADPTVFVNATYDYWGRPDGPRPVVNAADIVTVGPADNGITPGPILFAPWYTDEGMTTLAPVNIPNL